MFVVGSGKVLRTYDGERSTCIGSLTRDANSVAVYDRGPSARDKSNDALNPRSASSGCWIFNRVRPAASVSSVIGVGPKNPVPTDSLLVHRPARASADTRGLKKVPYSLWTSSRPLDDTDNAGVTLTSYWTNTPGTVKT